MDNSILEITGLIFTHSLWLIWKMEETFCASRLTTSKNPLQGSSSPLRNNVKPPTCWESMNDQTPLSYNKNITLCFISLDYLTMKYSKESILYSWASHLCVSPFSRRSFILDSYYIFEDRRFSVFFVDVFAELIEQKEPFIETPVFSICSTEAFLKLGGWLENCKNAP